MSKENHTIIPDLTVKQAAEQCQLSQKAIRRAIKSGLIKAYKISERNTRITQQALDEFKNSGGVAI